MADAATWPSAPDASGGSRLNGSRRTVVVLAARWPAGGPPWSSGDEEATVLRSMAAALALHLDVHVVTPGDGRPTRSVDGAFTVHGLGTGPDRSTAVRRALLVEAVVSSGRSVADVTVATRARGWLRASSDPWRGAAEVVAGLGPVAVVVAGHRHVGVTDALPEATPVIGVPLAAEGDGLGHPLFDPVLGRSAAVLTASAGERDAVRATSADTHHVHDVGLVVPVNPSVLQEPSTELAGQDYVLVLGADRGPGARRSADALAMRFAGHPVVLVERARLAIWRHGVPSYFDPVTRHIDLWRLMAWARCTVDLRPGALLPLPALESLLLSTPVVVPEDGRARRVVEDMGGGVWFADTAELLECVDALLDGRGGKAIGEQGRRAAEAHYGRRDDFVGRVERAVAGTLPS